MRKLIVQQWVTVDNIAAEDDGGLSFVSGEPFSDTDTSPFKTEMMRFITSVDTMILGANTYTMSKDYWPTATDQGAYGRELNGHAKIVASTKLGEAPWGDFPAAAVTDDPAETIRQLKDQPGQDLWLWGSLTLMHSLLSDGLIDEIRMLVCPASRGAGRRIFEDARALTLLEATPFENGVVLMRYAL